MCSASDDESPVSGALFGRVADGISLLLPQVALPSSATELETYLADTKDSQQALLKAISARLSKEVVANYQAFIDGMRQIGEIDDDVSKASIQVGNSLRKLGSARESLVRGTLGITYQRRRRERMADVAGRLRWVRSLFRVDEEVQVGKGSGDVDKEGGCMAGIDEEVQVGTGGGYKSSDGRLPRCASADSGSPTRAPTQRSCAELRFAEAVAFIVDAGTKLRDPSTRSYAVLGNFKTKVRSLALLLLLLCCSSAAAAAATPAASSAGRRSSTARWTSSATASTAPSTASACALTPRRTAPSCSGTASSTSAASRRAAARQQQRRHRSLARAPWRARAQAQRWPTTGWEAALGATRRCSTMRSVA